MWEWLFIYFSFIYYSIFVQDFEGLVIKTLYGCEHRQVGQGPCVRISLNLEITRPIHPETAKVSLNHLTNLFSMTLKLTLKYFTSVNLLNELTFNSFYIQGFCCRQLFHGKTLTTSALCTSVALQALFFCVFMAPHIWRWQLSEPNTQSLSLWKKIDLKCKFQHTSTWVNRELLCSLSRQLNWVKSKRLCSIRCSLNGQQKNRLNPPCVDGL